MKETKYDIYTDLGTLVKENVSKEEAIEYMSKGLTESLHFCYIAKIHKDVKVTEGECTMYVHG